MNNTNDVDTQDVEVLNTETDLEIDDLDTDADNEDTGIDASDDEPSSEPELSSDLANALDDDQFLEYLESGKLPEKIQIAKKEKVHDKSNGTKKEPTEKINNSDTRRHRERSAEQERQKVGSDSDNKNKDGNRKNEHSDDDRSEPSSNKETGNVDYKAVYDSIFKPFKANGKEIAPQTVDEIISLMQMGANYTQKMQRMAPLRKTVESLNKADIKEDDLNFLIDVHKGNKEAIKKLLEKHKVDPIELDMENTNYVPSNNIISDEDVEYLNAVEDVRDSIPKIREIMSEKWDRVSKDRLIADPNLVRALHEEIELDRFDKVQAQLEREKTFGRYRGIPDIEAYSDIVRKMYPIKAASTNAPSVAKEKPTNTPNRNIPDKSKAAPTKHTKAGVQGTQLTRKDILSMPEEEFLKLQV